MLKLHHIEGFVFCFCFFVFDKELIFYTYHLSEISKLIEHGLS